MFNNVNVNDNDNRFIEYKNKRMQSKKYKELFKQNDFKLIDKYILNVKKTYAKKQGEEFKMTISKRNN